MTEKQKKKKNPVIVILICVLVIIAIIAAIRVGFIFYSAHDNYENNSKNAEGMTNLEYIKLGAMSYYKKERCADNECSAIETDVFPRVKEAVYLPKAEIPAEERVRFDSFEFDAEPWKSLQFSITHPARFRYGYISSADGKKFTAVAQRRISDKRCVTIRIVGVDGVVSDPEIVSEGEKCVPAEIVNEVPVLPAK